MFWSMLLARQCDPNICYNMGKNGENCVKWNKLCAEKQFTYSHSFIKKTSKLIS